MILVQVLPRDDPRICTIGGETGICEPPTGASWAILIVFMVAYLVGIICYYGLLQGQRGQTWGKRALSIRVVDVDTGEPIGAGRGIGRYFATFLSRIPCYLGYLWMLWDRDNQTWHDKVVRSRVVVD